MKTKFTSILLIIFLAGTNLCQSQQKNEAERILQAVEKYYKQADEYDYSISFNMYRGRKGTKSEKSYDGRVAKLQNNIYYEAADTETVSGKDFYVRVSHAQKVLEYSFQPKKSLESSPVNISNFITYFKEKKIREQGNQWICTLSVGKFTALPYDTVELYIDKDYTITKQVLYFLKKIPFTGKSGKEEMDYPRLEIRLSKNKKPEDSEIFNKSRYVNVISAKVTPAKSLKNYKIIDLSKK